jgi:NAD(P)-dependent dehydrogenase (short-subunit alcohol dehydrogenase family)
LGIHSGATPRGRIHCKPSPSALPRKEDISTLLGIGHFYFALTGAAIRAFFEPVEGLLRLQANLQNRIVGPGPIPQDAGSVAVLYAISQISATCGSPHALPGLQPLCSPGEWKGDFMRKLDGKVALITGAKGGLGTFTTNAFLEAGATVAGVSRSIRANDFAHPAFAAVPGELSTGEAARRLVDEVLARFGRIDALVHLVGGFSGGQTVAGTADETLERMLDLNYRSAFYMARAVLPAMRKQGAGRILAVASRAAVEPAATIGAYAASKAALVALVRTIALENRDVGIAANSILPGTMDTPANRAAEPNADYSQWVAPAHVAELLVHLASDAGAAINGAAIPVYGRQV